MLGIHRSFNAMKTAISNNSSLSPSLSSVYTRSSLRTSPFVEVDGLIVQHLNGFVDANNVFCWLIQRKHKLLT